MRVKKSVKVIGESAGSLASWEILKSIRNIRVACEGKSKSLMCVYFYHFTL